MKRVRITILIAILFVSAGLAVMLLPILRNLQYRNQTRSDLEAFLRQRQERVSNSESTGQEAQGQADDTDANGTGANGTAKGELDLSALLALLRRENERLYREKQSDLKDPFSYELPGIDLSVYGIEDGIIGYIRIPRIDQVLPIRLGANEASMSKGAVHMTQTSYPIGGTNTNSVIAAHRGYTWAKMLSDIEEIRTGDAVYIENLWETLTYQVAYTKVIQPEDVEEILIREGEDMVTLLTCHPLGHNRQRYLVYCVRE